MKIGSKFGQFYLCTPSIRKYVQILESISFLMFENIIQSNLGGERKNKHYSSSYFLPSKLCFGSIKLIFQNCYNLKFQRSIISTINIINTRQSSHHFYMGKILKIQTYLYAKKISKWDDSLKNSIIKKLLALRS